MFRPATPRRLLQAGAACLLLLGSAVSATPAAPPADLEALQQQAQRLLAEGDIPGIGVALLRDGEPLWIGGLGVADRSSGRVVAADTPFRIGSITKTLTAMAILQQVERGRLSLDDEVRELLPELPIDNPWEATDPVRVVHLLEHTAGFDDLHFRNVLAIPGQGTLEELQRFDRELVVRWRPGERHSYSNPGYGLLGLILERASGMPGRDYIDRELRAPLGMADGGWHEAALGGRQAFGHDHRDGRVLPWEESTLPLAGSLLASANDMAALAGYFLSGGASVPGLLSADSLARMERTETTLAARAGLRQGYGLGNISSEREGRLYRGHSGGTEGYYANLVYDRDSSIALAFLSNTMESPTIRPLQNLLLGYAAGERAAPAAEAAVAADPQWNGWYQKSNPRNAIDALDVLLNVGYLAADGDHYTSTHALGLDASSMVALAGQRLRDPDDRHADGVLTRDADGRRVFVTDDNVFVQRPWAVAVLPLYAITAALLLLLSSLLLAPLWLWRALRGRYRGRWHGRRGWPLLAALALAACLLALSQLSLPQLTRGLPDLTLWTIAIGTVVFALAGAAGLVQGLRRWRAGGSRWLRLHALATSLGVLAISGWLAQAGLLGVRLWAW